MGNRWATLDAQPDTFFAIFTCEIMAAKHQTSPKALVAARRREASKPGRQKQSGRGSGLTPRVRQAIDRLVFGDEAQPTAIVRLMDAATFAGLQPRALRVAMLKPAVDAYYQRQMIALRNGERAASLRTIAEIRDDPALKGNAAGATARLKAAERLLYDPPGQSVQVNVGVAVQATVTPGYVIDLTPEDEEERRAALVIEGEVQRRA